MQFKEYGVHNSDVIVLLHGGGLAPWNYYEEANLLKDKFRIIIPILDGHSGSDRNFASIEENSHALIDFIDESFGGKVLLIGGLSLGGQILVEILSQRKDICKFAVIESALVLPMPFTSMLIKPAFSLCYSLVKTRWFAKLQFKSLHICPAFFEDYFRDTAAITKENMISFLMANANYKMKNSLSECQAKVLVLVGDKEQKIMKKSSEMIKQQIQNAELTILPDYFHGDLSINHADKYVTKVLDLIYNG